MRLPFAFLSPFGVLGATYDVHLRLTGKRIVDSLLVLIELFSLGVTAEVLRANIGSKSAISLQRRPVDQKVQPKSRPLTSHSSEKTRLIFHVTRMRTFFRFVTNHAFDRQTDSFLVARPR